MRAAVAAALAAALLAGCEGGGGSAAPSPSQTASPSPSPSPRDPAEAVGGIPAALRAAGSAHVQVEVPEGDPDARYRASFDVVFATGALLGGYVPLAREYDTGFEIRRVPPATWVNAPNWADPDGGPPWQRIAPSGNPAHRAQAEALDRFVRGLGLPRCARHLRWVRRETVPLYLLAHRAETAEADVFQGRVPVADCVPPPPALPLPRGRVRLTVQVTADGRPVRYLVDLGAETMVVAFSEFGSTDSVQPPPPGEVG